MLGIWFEFSHGLDRLRNSVKRVAKAVAKANFATCPLWAGFCNIGEAGDGGSGLFQGIDQQSGASSAT